MNSLEQVIKAAELISQAEETARLSYPHASHNNIEMGHMINTIISKHVADGCTSSPALSSQQAGGYYAKPVKPQKLSEEERALRKFTCNVCGNKFKDSNAMKYHLITHSDKREFVCDYAGCNYAFKTKGSLKRHIRCHTGEKPYSCELCGRSFAESGALSRHLKSRTKCIDKPEDDMLLSYGKLWTYTPDYSIEPVKKKNSSKKSREKSEDQKQTDVAEENNKHTEEKMERTVAEEKADDVDSLEKFIMESAMLEGSTVVGQTVARPSEVGDVIDDISTQSSGNQYALMTVRGKHEGTPGENPVEKRQEISHETPVPRIPMKRRKMCEEKKSFRKYTCNICGNSYRDFCVLKTHLSTHSSKRPFPCSHPGCQQAFKTKGSLKRHMRCHTGERPYPCELCGRSFTESGALSRHLKSRTPCKNKSDRDLPRYGKKWIFSPKKNITKKSVRRKRKAGINAEITSENYTTKSKRKVKPIKVKISVHRPEMQRVGEDQTVNDSCDNNGGEIDSGVTGTFDTRDSVTCDTASSVKRGYCDNDKHKERFQPEPSFKLVLTTNNKSEIVDLKKVM